MGTLGAFYLLLAMIFGAGVLALQRLDRQPAYVGRHRDVVDRAGRHRRNDRDHPPFEVQMRRYRR